MWELKEERGRKVEGGRAAQCSLSPDLDDATAWVREVLGFAADDLQAQVLRTKTKRGLLNCSRQWGKSTITAAKAVHQAHRTAGA